MVRLEDGEAGLSTRTIKRRLVQHDLHGDWNYTITAADNPDVTRPK